MKGLQGDVVCVCELTGVDVMNLICHELCFGAALVVLQPFGGWVGLLTAACIKQST
jgi:hypothetical protein